MGCCNSLTLSDTEYDKLLYKILSTHPVNALNSAFCLNQYKVNESEITTKTTGSFTKPNTHRRDKSNTKNEINQSMTEEKFYSMLEFLFQMKLTNDVSRTFIKTKTSRKKTAIDREVDKEFMFSPDTNLLSIDTRDHYKDNILNDLFFSIVPDYFEMSTILKDRFECSFLLSIIGLTKENNTKKAAHLLYILENSGMKPNISNFRIIIQSYFELSFTYSKRLLNIIMSQKKEELIIEIDKQFELKITNDVLECWKEEIQQPNINKINSAVHLICRELVNIVVSQTTLEDIEEYKSTFLHSLDHLTVIEVCEMILKVSHVDLTKDMLIILLDVHPYLFRAVELQRYLKKISIPNF